MITRSNIEVLKGRVITDIRWDPYFSQYLVFTDRFGRVIFKVKPHELFDLNNQWFDCQGVERVAQDLRQP